MWGNVRCIGTCDGVWLFGKDSFEECPLTVLVDRCSDGATVHLGVSVDVACWGLPAGVFVFECGCNLSFCYW